MKIKILESAKEDLKEGFHFYELQERGIGKYFLEALSDDIESLRLFAGVHSIHFSKYYRLLSKDSLSQSITVGACGPPISLIPFSCPSRNHPYFRKRIHEVRST